MRAKARGLLGLALGLSKQNGSSVCGGLEPFLFASVNDQGWAPKISPLPQFAFLIVAHTSAVVESK